MNNNKKISTNLLIKIALLSAIAVVLMYFDFPILPGFDFLKIDLSDVAALIGAFAYGPIVGAIIELIKNILILLVKGSTSVGIGEVANLIIGVSLIVPAALIYSKNKTRKTAVKGLIAGTITMSIVGALANYFVFIPMYKAYLPSLNTTIGIVEYLTYGIIPFNLIKGTLVSIVTVLIYKYVAKLILRESEVNNSFSSSNRKTA